jgi:peptidyl-prolyl cis-trans isomerase SurA
VKTRFVRALLAPITLVAALTAPKQADASIVERVVAVVGERPLLLSELRQRARPHLIRIAATIQDPTRQAMEENGLYKELLNRMIDERLEEQAADKAHLSVTPDEVDAGIKQVAAQAKLAPRDVVLEARKQGLSEQDYRDEIRRQVLEGKLIQLRVRGRVRVTEQDARAAYAHVVKESQEQTPVDVRILVRAIKPGSTQQQVDVERALATEIAKRAKAGEDFCDLVLNYSQDPSTLKTCGSRGPVPMTQLFPQLQEVAKGLKPGETSAPVDFRDPSGNDAILVVQLASQQPKLPAYEEVREQMMERAYVEQTERQRKQWLVELRRGVYIDVRL